MNNLTLLPLYNYILIYICSIGCLLASRYMGNPIETCDNWKDRLSLWFCLFMAININFLLMALLCTFIKYE